MPDYHTRPVLAARVRPDSKTWARAEAERRGMGVGEFLDALIDAERDRGSGPVVGYLIDGSIWHPSDVTIVRRDA